MQYPYYQVHFLQLGDADCIAIQYQKDAASDDFVTLVDAGNVSDAEAIKHFLKRSFGSLRIDLAICTHPDGDHKGGFFGLMEDSEVSIHELWVKHPSKYIGDDDFTKMKRRDSKWDACNRVYNHPSDASKNLIDLANQKKNPDGTKCRCLNVSCGMRHEFLPLEVIGPSEVFYREVAKGIVSNFAELNVQPDTSEYDENDEVSESDAKSVIDDVNEVDNSFSNMGSIVLLFEPDTARRMILTGDANSSSLRDICSRLGSRVTNCILKVPHHGSKHNLNSEIIDTLKPRAAIICAKGSVKHPSNAIVRYLSKYCNVFSTHKGPLCYLSWNWDGDAEPLKAKITS